MNKQIAITLLEMLVTLTIISILSMITVPALQDLLQQSQESAVKNDILHMLAFARNEADLRQKTITMCRSSNLHECGGEWSGGQIIFIDVANNGKVQHESLILSANQRRTVHGQIKMRFYPYYRTYIQFHPLQFESNDNGTIWYCRKSSSLPAWAIEVSQSGETHVKLPDQSGRIIDDKGRALQC